MMLVKRNEYGRLIKIFLHNVCYAWLFYCRLVSGKNEMDPDSIEDSVYLNLATSFISATGSSTDQGTEQQSRTMDTFDESDDEPLVRKQTSMFSTSDDEPLSL